MAKGMKLNKADLKRLQNNIDKAISTSMQDTYNYYKKETPRKGGNARNKTKFNKSRNSINSNYDYAGRLDSGWSKQSPKGFTKPSLNFLENTITKKFKRI
tara:strand:- start:321 stop:620 length:300 start_codon:yes stop_codon:yes gene_type:complete